MTALRIDRRIGFDIVAGASAFPGPITSPAGTVHERVCNEDIFQFLLGDGWPEKCKAMNLDPSYPETVVGLKQRYWTHWPGTPISHDETNSVDLAVEACTRALETADLAADDIDLMVMATTSPIKITSSTAAAVGARLAMEAPAIEMKAGCSSGLYAFLTALSYMQVGAKRVLVVASETLSKFAPPTAQQAVFNVADGAGALILESKPASDRGLVCATINLNGQLGEALIGTPGLLPPTVEAVEAGRYFYDGDPKGLKETALEKYAVVFETLLADGAMTPEDISLYIPHQVNLQIIRETIEPLGIPMERTFVNIGEYANFGSPTILVGLHEALEQGRIGQGDRVVLAVVGGGLTWGGAVLQF